MKYILLILATVMVNGYLDAQHYVRYQRHYDKCVQELQESDNYETNEQAFDCVASKKDMKILGTLLFKEGSVL